jgi:hypothetical protein
MTDEELIKLLREWADGMSGGKQVAELVQAADRIEALKAEVERLRDEKDDAISTLDAWFDRQKLGHEAVDQAVLDAAKGYLRVSRNGGMDREQSDLIEGVIADMARLGMFADLFARATLEKQP